MNDNIYFIPLKEISKISKGISVKSKTWKSTSRDEIEEQYGVQKNDIVISKKIYSTGKKIAVLIKDTTITVVPSGSSLIIRPDTTRLFSPYLKAFLEFIPSDKVIKELNLISQKHLLSKGSLEKLLVPLPSLEEQMQLSSEYEKVKNVDLNNRYCNPIIEQYDSLRKFFWDCYN